VDGIAFHRNRLGLGSYFVNQRWEWVIDQQTLVSSLHIHGVHIMLTMPRSGIRPVKKKLVVGLLVVMI